MKTIFCLFLGYGLLSCISGQSLESVIIQIEDLKAERDEHEMRINAIDSELEDLYNKRHALTASFFSGGHPAQTIVEIELFSATYGSNKKVLAIIPKRTRIIIEEAETISFLNAATISRWHM